MQNIKLFIELTRLNRPIGYMLLFWPCLWGLTIAFNFNSELEKFYFYSLLNIPVPSMQTLTRHQIPSQEGS